MTSKSSRSLIVAMLAGVIMSGAAFAQGGMGAGTNDWWQPGWMHRHMWGGFSPTPEFRARRERHWAFMHEGVPAAYAGAQSNADNAIATLQAGGKLYVSNCASCHGKTGDGNGDGGKALSPSPALLSWLIQRPMAVDEYLLWTISDGGVAMKTGMPAFKDALSRDDIWKIVAYMRAGFPKVE